MKKIVSLVTAFCLAFNLSVVSSMAGNAAKLELTSTKQEVAVGQAFSLTVKAVDDAGKTADTYKWSIFWVIMTNNVDTAEVVDGKLFSSDWYVFTAADKWQKAFTDIKFKKEWTYEILVADFDDNNIDGKISVTVTWGSSKSSSGSTDWTTTTEKSTFDGNLEISSPEEWTKIFDWKTSVAGLAKKNSKLKVFVNGKEAGETQSDAEWNYSFDVSGLDQKSNKIEVKLYDGSDKVITTKSVTLGVDTDGPTFTSIVVKEWDNVTAGAALNMEVIAQEWLKEVKVTIWEESQLLEESAEEPGKYTGTITAPATDWEYPITLSLKDETGKETIKEDAKTVMVWITWTSSLFKNIQVSTQDKKIIFKFELESESKDVSKFKIKYGSGSDNLDKEVITYEKEKIEVKSGSGQTEWNKVYSWYISTLDPNGKYSFQLFALDKDWKELSSINPSDVIEFPMLNSAGGKCSISNISGLKTTRKWDKVELSWDKLTEASSYNIYKKDENGNMVFLENVKDNKYLVHITGDKVKFEEFAVKWVCGEWEAKAESKDFSQLTKIQTWPKEIAAIIAISLILSYFFVVRRRKSELN